MKLRSATPADLLQTPDLNNKLGRVSEDPRGCLQLCLTEVANNLRNPVLVLHSGEQLGVVWVFLRDSSRLETPFLDMSSAVMTPPWPGDERGFLGFHPQYRANGRFFIYYSLLDTSKPQMIRISEMKVSARDMNVAAPHRARLASGALHLQQVRLKKSSLISLRVILEIQEPAANHNGGQLLWSGRTLAHLHWRRREGWRSFWEVWKCTEPVRILSEAGISPESVFSIPTWKHSSHRSVLLGKVLRIDVDGPQSDVTPCRIPPDNPFLGHRHARAEVYAYGVRNMWRCSVDRGDPVSRYGAGRIFCGDVGQNRYEEMDIIVRGGNYGWRAMA